MKQLISIFVILVAFSACKSGKTKNSKEYATAFEDKEYQLLSIEDRDVTGMELAMRVDTDRNSIVGESGCNNYQFNYQLDGENLDLGYGIATKMYCEETMETENFFFGAASKVKHFSMADGMLYFLDENGKVLLKAKEQKRTSNKDTE